MLRQAEIARIIDIQKVGPKMFSNEVTREKLAEIKSIPAFACIITGMRRVGKSTLLRQIAQRHQYVDTIYLNFDDIRLSAFERDDFERLYSEIVARKARELFFDEIQLVKGWEIFVHQLLREGFYVYVSGSNASMLSVDLGTHLTGRHLQNELFSFSYAEYLALKGGEPSAQTFNDYMKVGGIPEYLKTGEPLILSTLLDDVLVRDIAINKGVANVRALRQLAVYLLTNIGKPYSANRLKEFCNVGSTTTVLDYISYLKDAYLIDSIGLYDDSLHVTIRNPKKVYAYDTGLAHSLSLSRTPDLGRLLENEVFIYLRHRYAADHIYYMQGNGECDFVTTDIHNRPDQAIQVCYDLNGGNFRREIDGLTEAMKRLGLDKGIIVTGDEEDEFATEQGRVYVVKAWKYFKNP